MRKVILLGLSLLATSSGAASAQSAGSGNSGYIAPHQTIKDDSGGIFMEETTKPAPKPKNPVMRLDMTNVGVQVDPQGKIVPLLNAPGTPPVQQQGSSTQAYTEYFVPAYPYGGSVPVYGPGFPYTPLGGVPVFGAPYGGGYPAYGAPYGGYPVYGAPYGGYGAPGGVNIGIGSRRFGLGLNLGGGGFPGYGPYGGYGAGLGGYPAYYPGGGVPFSVAPFGTPTSANFPVVYGNGTISSSSTVEQSSGLGIGPALGWGKSSTRTFSTPWSYNSTQNISTPWLNSTNSFGSSTRSLLSPLMQP